MSSQVAPWLEDLDEDWVAPPSLSRLPESESASAFDMASSVRNKQSAPSTSRIPRRSSGAGPGAFSNNNSVSRRNPLRDLPNSATNATNATNAVRSASNSSVVHHDSVKRSPDKHQQTLEWKKRLVRGELGYGDQTDLFGPSGLENIFSPARPSSSSNNINVNNNNNHNNPRPSSSNNPSKLLQNTIMPPSSPPPWPSQIESPEAHGTYLRGPDDSIFSDQNDESLAQSEDSHAHLHPPTDSALRDRVISGLTDLSGETFSPVFISKHTTSTGQISYAALDARSREASSRNHSSVAAHDANLPSTPGVQRSYTDAIDSTLPSAPEVSLPDNLPTGTPPIPSFVSLKRTSPSASEQDRPSSPDYTTRSPSVVRRDPGSPELSSPRRVPATPGTADESSLLSPPKSRPSQSPLKLFGNYDTFTNNRLFRRMSQLEGVDPDHAIVSEANNIKPRDRSSSQGQTSDFISSINTPKRHTPQQRVVSNLSSFGEGEFDHHDFGADLSFPTGLDFDASLDSTDGSPLPGAQPPGSRTPFRFHVETAPSIESSPQGKSPFKLKRKLSKRSTARSTYSDDGQALEKFPAMQSHVDEFELKEGKRPQTSPAKAPTPKRRRTLVSIDGKLPGLGQGSEIHLKITGDAEKLATSQNKQLPPINVHPPGTTRSSKRDVTRPRNPTPSQRRREQLQAEISEATFDYLDTSPRLEAIKETLEELSELPPDEVEPDKAKAVAAEVAAFTFDISRVDSEGTRKRSITTQDFLDEAMHIMSLIRAKGRPRSGLGDVEESNGEVSYGSLLGPMDGPRPASSLRISRPPSREGESSGWKPRSQMIHNPNVASHLEQFREDHTVEMVESSLRSLRVDHFTALDSEDEDISTRDLQHAPIIEPGQVNSRSRADSNASEQEPASPTKSHGSHPSIDSARTVGTSSSRKSDLVANLSPSKVAHLIPEQVAGMIFDKEKQTWVRNRHLKPPTHDYFHPPSNISSEDDPFGNIPDLTVDEIKELHRIRGCQSNFPHLEHSEYDAYEQYPELPRSVSAKPCLQRQDINTSRPTTRDSNVPNPFTSSTAPSKYSVFASSQHQVDTRATSWSNEELAKMAQAKQQQQQHRHQTGDGLRDIGALNIPQHISEETEVVLEDSVLSGDQSSFEEELSENESSVQEDSLTEELPAPKQRESAQPWFQDSPQPAVHGPARHVSLRRQTFQRGFGDADVDQREVSFVATLPDKRKMNLSVSVTQHQPRMAAPKQEYGLSSPTRVDGTFYLSDLPEFTVNEIDEERPSEKALARRIARHNSGDRYSMAVQSLVKTLTDVEPDEPYWEDIKQLNLREKNLDSVHNLEDFCARLEDLDLSGNNIAHLEGAPTSIRRLNLRSNALSSLTAWSHMMNLQYLDISNNDIDNLGGLCMLIHLRELRADDNHISSLDGIMGMDGLLKLSVRNNQLSSVDFDGCQLRRIEDLDISENKLSSVSGLHDLPALERLILDNNELDRFDAFQGYSKIMSLSLQNNQLRWLDVTSHSNLRYLNVDENRLSNIQGLDCLRQLDTLSMRKQNLNGLNTKHVSIFSQRLFARSLFLSSNIIPTLDLAQSYHSVQNLELASCGVHDLPGDFGLRFPNLRTLNISFNTIVDIRPLLNITRLEKLYASGNHVARLRKTIAVLARMPHLRIVDLRDNPMTHGFYAPVATTTKSIVAIGSRDTEPLSETELQQQAALSHRLPFAEASADAEHMARLDEDTKLHRRVYDILLSNGCKTLHSLDGLDFAKDKAQIRDVVWERLVKLGVVRKSAKGETCVVEGVEA